MKQTFFKKTLGAILGLTLCNSAYAITHYMSAHSNVEAAIWDVIANLARSPRL